jgi:glycosyltransferase involved in cell wall biosynthesis
VKLCFVVDGRSVIAKNWIRYFVDNGHEVHLISTFPCDPSNPPVASLHVASLDFSAHARAANIGGSGGGLTTHGNPFFARLRGSLLWKTLAKLRDLLNPFAVAIQQRKVRRIIRQLNPDLVHAMRIPFEGILAARALEGEQVPLLVSVWGNDFTLFAKDSPEIARLTRRAMGRADALHPDCERDLHLAREYGLDAEKPFAVLPGNGGVRTDVFQPGVLDLDLRRRWNIPPDVPVIINPRGVKPYIRTDTFFQAIPLILAERPDVFFLGAMMEGNSVAEGWISRLQIEKSIVCLPFVSHDEMAQFFRLATITISPADHDGTPNTLLEAMSCGTFPVAGNIESVREWITSGENGLLFDQSDPASLAQAVLQALRDTSLRDRAVPLNQKLIQSRADYAVSMHKANEFYHQLITRSQEQTHEERDAVAR